MEDGNVWFVSFVVFFCLRSLSAFSIYPVLLFECRKLRLGFYRLILHGVGYNCDKVGNLLGQVCVSSLIPSSSFLGHGFLHLLFHLIVVMLLSIEGYFADVVNPFLKKKPTPRHQNLVTVSVQSHIFFKPRHAIL